VLGLFLTSSRGGAVALGVGLVLLFAIGAPRVRLVVTALLAGAGSAALIALAVGRDLFTDGRVNASGYGSEAGQMLLATLVVAGIVFAIRTLVDGLVERIRVPRKMSVAVAVSVALAIAATAIAIDPAERFAELRKPPDDTPQFYSRGLVTRHLASTEGTGRWQFWQAGWEAFRAEPLVGIGAGGYEAWWAQNGSIERFVRNAHSLFVETGAELGVLGLLLLVGFLAAPVVRVLGRRSMGPTRSAAAGGALAALGCGTVAAGLEWTWEVPAAFAPVVVAAAVLAGPAHAAGRDREGRRHVWSAAVVVVGCAAVLAAAVALVSDANLRASRAAAREGDYARAAVAARRVKELQPWAAEPWLQLALVEESGDLQAARRAADEAIERSPEDWRIWLVAARLRTKAGDIGGALSALRHARRLSRQLPPLPLLAG
jgi:tetratricopeptide (TPR) repeat protein